MHHLRLMKGLSYNGVVSATKELPDVWIEDPELFAAALKSGYFCAINDVPNDDNQENNPSPNQNESPEQNPEQDPEANQLAKMTVEELKKYAKDKGVSLAGCSTRQEILRKLDELAADAAAAEAILAQSQS